MSENEKNYFLWNEKAFKDAVKGVVCPECPYDGFDCKNPDPRGCALFRYLPDLVRIAQRMENPSLSEYARAVEMEIPFHCEWTASADRPCPLMDTPSCGLDKLFPHLLKAVLETDRLLEARPPFRP